MLLFCCQYSLLFNDVHKHINNLATLMRDKKNEVPLIIVALILTVTLLAKAVLPYPAAFSSENEESDIILIPLLPPDLI